MERVCTRGGCNEDFAEKGRLQASRTIAQTIAHLPIASAPEWPAARTGAQFSGLPQSEQTGTETDAR
jgi:hypothetical protein